MSETREAADMLNAQGTAGVPDAAGAQGTQAPADSSTRKAALTIKTDDEHEMLEAIETDEEPGMREAHETPEAHETRETPAAAQAQAAQAEGLQADTLKATPAADSVSTKPAAKAGRSPARPAKGRSRAAASKTAKSSRKARAATSAARHRAAKSRTADKTSGSTSSGRTSGSTRAARKDTLAELLPQHGLAGHTDALSSLQAGTNTSPRAFPDVSAAQLSAEGSRTSTLSATLTGTGADAEAAQDTDGTDGQDMAALPEPGSRALALQLQDARGRSVQLVCNLLWEAGTLVSGAGSALRLDVPWQESVPVSRQAMARRARALGCDRLVLTGSRFGMLSLACMRTVPCAAQAANLGSRPPAKPLSLAVLALRELSDTPAAGKTPGRTAADSAARTAHSQADSVQVRGGGVVCVFTLPVQQGGRCSELYWVWAARGRVLSAQADRIFADRESARALADAIAESLGAGVVRWYGASESLCHVAEWVRRAGREEVRAASLLPLEPVSPARLVLAAVSILLTAALLAGGQTLWEWWETRARTTLLSQTRGELAKRKADIERNPCRYFDISWQTRPGAAGFVREIIPDMLAFPLAGNGWMLSELEGRADSLQARWKALPASILLYPPKGAVNEDAHPEYARQTVARNTARASGTRNPARAQAPAIGMDELLRERDLRRLLAELITRFSLRLRLRFSRPEAIMVGETRVEAPWVKGSVSLEVMPDYLVHDYEALARVLDIPGLALSAISWDGRHWKATGDVYVLRDRYAGPALQTDSSRSTGRHRVRNQAQDRSAAQPQPQTAEAAARTGNPQQPEPEQPAADQIEKQHPAAADQSSPVQAESGQPDPTQAGAGQTGSAQAGATASPAS